MTLEETTEEIGHLLLDMSIRANVSMRENTCHQLVAVVLPSSGFLALYQMMAQKTWGSKKAPPFPRDNYFIVGGIRFECGISSNVNLVVDCSDALSIHRTRFDNSLKMLMGDMTDAIRIFDTKTGH